MKIDGRALDHKTPETIRLMAGRRVREGESPAAVMRSYGYSRTVICKWLAAAKRPGGERNPASRKGSGRPRRLTARQARQEARVRRFICGKDPRHFPPGCAPDLTPDEFAWREVKSSGLSKKPPRRNEPLRRRVRDDLAALKQRPGGLRAVFHAPSVSCVAD